MSKVGRDRKGIRYQSKTKRQFPWRPIQATHEIRHEVVKKASGHIDYKPIKVQKPGARIQEGPNRAERRRLAKLAKRV